MMLKKKIRPCPSYPGYAADIHGNVWTWNFGRTGAPGVLRPVEAHGYQRVDLKGFKFASVHECVLDAFVGPRPDGMQCRHLDGDRKNNRPGNLAWGTPKENQADRLIHGTDTSIGVKNPSSKLNDAIVRVMRRCFELGMHLTDIGSVFGVTRQTASLVCNLKTWTHVSHSIPLQQLRDAKGGEANDAT